jgi:uncharacterized protein
MPFSCKPTMLAETIWQIDLPALWEASLRGLILDLDNTLTDWNATYLRPEIREWIEQAKSLGFQLCLVSNAIKGRRVKAIAAELGIGVVTWACKPLARGYRKGMALMGTTPISTCVLGDQVFTDILGANIVGARSILLTPLSPKESPHTQLIRRIEAPLRRKWGRG